MYIHRASLFLEEYTESTEDLKESFTLYGPYKMAKTLNALDILNSGTFIRASNLQALSDTHLASVLVDELSQDTKEHEKYTAFLIFLEKETSLLYVHYKMSFISKYLYLSSVLMELLPIN